MKREKKKEMINLNNTKLNQEDEINKMHTPKRLQPAQHIVAENV
jgi:hypothetical protein